MGKESHYSSKKDRVFVRGIQGQYSLKDELQRLRRENERLRAEVAFLGKVQALRNEERR